MRLHEGMRLYHGSSVVVERPDLSRCSPRKDFGRGFYLTSSISQARDFARIVAKRAVRETGKEVSACVSVFNLASLDGLTIKTFKTADLEWLHCIAAHRQGTLSPAAVDDFSGVDVLVGKVANDQTNATILAYLAGAYGELGSERAASICVSLLLPERLKDQACFRTQKALGCLKYYDCEEACL